MQKEVHIRKGTLEDFYRLHWAWYKDGPTQQVFAGRIQRGTQEFWVIEPKLECHHTQSGEHRELMGEFHIVWESPDKDEADGKGRAYLCAFRTHPDYRGQGLGTALMRAVLSRVKEAGRTEVTIGVEKDRPRVKEFYQKWGFTDVIKVKNIDHHNFSCRGEPNYAKAPIELLLKQLDWS